MVQQPVEAGYSIFDADQRRENTSPSHELEELAGEYVHPLYGTFKIVQEQDQLVGNYHGTEIKLEHWHYNVFVGSVDTAGPMELAFQFNQNLDGNIAEVEVGLDVFMTRDMIGFRRNN